MNYEKMQTVRSVLGDIVAFLCAVIFIVTLLGGLYWAGKVTAKTDPKPERAGPTMDNYSFSVGVWCAYRVIYSNDWREVDEGELLHSARKFSQTNGWPPFNNRIGFRGDEVAAPPAN